MGRTRSEASRRNWTKRRLMGLYFDISVLTEKEKRKYAEMMRLKQELIQDWDKQSEIYLGHPFPAYRCSVCGRRVNNVLVRDGVNICFSCG